LVVEAGFHVRQLDLVLLVQRAQIRLQVGHRCSQLRHLSLEKEGC
jgi:hypothetical protein